MKQFKKVTAMVLVLAGSHMAFAGPASPQKLQNQQDANRRKIAALEMKNQELAAKQDALQTKNRNRFGINHGVDLDAMTRDANAMQGQINELRTQNGRLENDVKVVRSEIDGRIKERLGDEAKARGEKRISMSDAMAKALRDRGDDGIRALAKETEDAYRDLDLLQSAESLHADARERETRLEALSLRIDNSVMGHYLFNRSQLTFGSKNLCDAVKGINERSNCEGLPSLGTKNYSTRTEPKPSDANSGGNPPEAHGTTPAAK